MRNHRRSSIRKMNMKKMFSKSREEPKSLKDKTWKQVSCPSGIHRLTIYKNPVLLKICRRKSMWRMWTKSKRKKKRKRKSRCEKKSKIKKALNKLNSFQLQNLKKKKYKKNQSNNHQLKSKSLLKSKRNRLLHNWNHLLHRNKSQWSSDKTLTMTQNWKRFHYSKKKRSLSM